MNEYFFIFLGLLTPVLVVLAFVKKKRASHSYAEEGELRGSESERIRDEKHLASLPVDTREEVLKTKAFYDKYTTHQGFTAEYMDRLSTKIRDSGIDCEVYFQTLGPMGFADSFIVQQGVFELYVDRDQLAQAQKTIPKLIA